MHDGIYKGQAQLNISLLCGVSIVGATETIIKYKKPSGQTGFWPARITDANKGIISYAVQSPSVLNEVGAWTIWAYVTFANGKPAPGKPYTMYVSEEGT